MSETKSETEILDAIKEAALADKRDDAPPPPTLPTIAMQNWYDANRNE